MLDVCFRRCDALLAYAGGLGGGSECGFQELVWPANVRGAFFLNQIVGVSTEDDTFSDQTAGSKEQRGRDAWGVFYNQEVIRNFSEEGIG